MAGLEAARRAYAEELRYVAGVRNPDIVEAFARVPRERFLGPGPWRLIGELAPGPIESSDADPRHVYHNVLVVLDAAKGANNGSPSLWARLFDEVGPRAGERVVHVGAGTGYYSAILAELVGPDGHVTAIELEPHLAERALEALVPYGNTTAVCADGTTYDAGEADLIVVNAGATHPVPLWLERLAPGGRLLLPLTADAPVPWVGAVLRVDRRPQGLAARFVSLVGIYPCHGARDQAHEKLLADAFGHEPLQALRVRSLRLDAHERDEDCWLHAPRYCLSRRTLD